jgi:tetratricopeptide (TPR) repeat protein
MRNKAGSNFAILGLTLAGLGWSCAARAAFTIFGDGNAQSCSEAARQVEKGHPPDPQFFAVCNQALTLEDLDTRDRAGTYINRGILFLARGSYADARNDFDSAVTIMPSLGEAYTNRGAALVGLRRYEEAISDLDRGLELKSGEPEKAYFNRALAEEGLDRVKDAYFDYVRAAELKPDWLPPRNELLRFSVSSPPS